jgi:hypothetical protein
MLKRFLPFILLLYVRSLNLPLDNILTPTQNLMYCLCTYVHIPHSDTGYLGGNDLYIRVLYYI